MTEEQREAIIALREEGMGYNQIALEVGTTTDAVRNFFYRNRKVGKEATDKTAILNAKIRALQKQVLKLKMAGEADLDFAKSISVPRYDVSFNTHFTDGEEVGVVNLSDIHFGLIMKSRINTYNTEIAQIRLGYYVDRINHIFAKYYPHIKRLIILLNGDLVDGTNIYKGQEYEAIPIDEQIAFLPSILAASLSKINLPFEVYEADGNHARITPNSGIHNWDKVVTYLVRKMLPDIKFHIATDFYQEIDIWNWTYIMMHGENITRSKTPQSFIERAIADYVNMFRKINLHFDGLFLGHYHNPNWLPSAIVNGAVCGATNFTQKKIKNGERPSQVIAIVNKKRGIVDVRKIFLDDMDEDGMGIKMFQTAWE